jgi:hypothetical protein
MTSTDPTNLTASGAPGASRVAQHPGFVAVGRAGWVAKGIVYGLVGVLALQIAVNGGSDARSGSGEGEASQLGAVAEIADRSYGTPLLWLIAVGLLLYGAWRLVSAALPAESSAKAWLTRIGYVVSAVVYGTLGWTAISFARGTGGGGESEDSRVERFTRDLMENTAGRWLVGSIGVAVVAIAIVFVVKGVSASFRDELEARPVGPISHEQIVLLGRVGWIGRGVVTALVGWLLIRAAVMFDPDEAQGIDGALRKATSAPLGALLVGLSAAALVVYGVFCIVSAPRQLLKPAD